MQGPGTIAQVFLWGILREKFSSQKQDILLE